MDYTLLKDLLKLVEEFQQEHASSSIGDFTIWLNNKLFATKKADKHSAHDELAIAFKLMHLNKDLKKQTKGILSASNVSSIDEYSFLLHLDHQDSFRKMEIIQMHNLEAPTGIEIIKRLLKKKLVEEFADKDDGRAKRVKITQRGIDEIKTIKPKIDMAFKNFVDPLQLNEKIQISGFLDKLIG